MGRKWIQPYKSVSSSPPFYPKQKQLYQVKAMHLPTYSILKHDRWRSSLGLLPWCILIIFNLSSWQISNINNNCTVQFLCVEPNFYCKYCCDDGDKSFLWSGSRHKISENLNTYRGMNIYFKISCFEFNRFCYWVLLFVRWNVHTWNAQLQIYTVWWDLRTVYMHLAYTLIERG